MTDKKCPVAFLLDCATQVPDANEAMKFTQAALNAAQALRLMPELPPERH